MRLLAAHVPAPAICSPLSANCSLLTAHCLLLTALCSRFIIDCSLLTAFCLLYPRFWYRHDEFPAPLADKGHLFDDLVLQIPGQNKKIVRPVLFDSIRREDLDMGPRSELPVFIRVAVDGVVQEVAADAAEVEKRVAFSRGSITDNGFSLPFRSIRISRILRLVSLTFSAKLEYVSIRLNPACNSRAFISRTLSVTGWVVSSTCRP